MPLLLFLPLFQTFLKNFVGRSGKNIFQRNQNYEHKLFDYVYVSFTIVKTKKVALLYKQFENEKALVSLVYWLGIIH